jgi:hypothetical protein
MESTAKKKSIGFCLENNVKSKNYYKEKCSICYELEAFSSEY